MPVVPGDSDLQSAAFATLALAGVSLPWSAAGPHTAQETAREVGGSLVSTAARPPLDVSP